MKLKQKSASEKQISPNMREKILGEYTLCFHVKIRIIMAITALVGILSWFLYLRKIRNQGTFYQPEGLHVFGLLLLPIGIGFFIWTLQKIDVSPIIIKSHLLGFTRTLSGTSTEIVKLTANGMIIMDNNHKKIFVHNVMMNFNRLWSELGRKSEN